MVKKIFSVIILAAVLIFVSGQSQAEAAEVYVGNYSDGSAVYLLTNTVVIKNYRPYTFNCRVRAGYDYLDYYFFPRNGSPYYRNSEGYEGFVNQYSPVADSIYSYVVNHF